jgi:hypothetical protein
VEKNAYKGINPVIKPAIIRMTSSVMTHALILKLIIFGFVEKNVSKRMSPAT